MSTKIKKKKTSKVYCLWKRRRYLNCWPSSVHRSSSRQTAVPGKNPDFLCPEPILSLLSWWIQTEKGEDGLPTNQMTGLGKVGLDHKANSCFHSLKSKGGMWPERSGNEEIWISPLPWPQCGKLGKVLSEGCKLSCAHCLTSPWARDQKCFRFQEFGSSLLCVKEYFPISKTKA